jgi:hypothetical protein
VQPGDAEDLAPLPPLLDPALMELYAPAFIIQHVVYGVVLGLVYMWLRPQPYQS